MSNNESVSTDEQGAPDPSKLITRAEAGELAGVDPKTVDRWANEGLVTRYKLGGFQWVRFDRDQVAAMRRPIATVETEAAGE